MRGEEVKTVNKGNSFREFHWGGGGEELYGSWRECRKGFLLVCLKREKLEHMCIIKGIKRFFWLLLFTFSEWGRYSCCWRFMTYQKPLIMTSSLFEAASFWLSSYPLSWIFSNHFFFCSKKWNLFPSFSLHDSVPYDPALEPLFFYTFLLSLSNKLFIPSTNIYRAPSM